MLQIAFDRQREWLKVHAFHNELSTSYLAVKWHDIVTNDSISAITGLDDIRHIVRRGRLGHFGHVARVDCNVPAAAHSLYVVPQETADHRT